MTLTGPMEPETAGAPDAEFEIEEGHFGPHLPRPPRDVLVAGGGTLLVLIGFYLPWLTLRQQTYPQSSNGSFAVGGPTMPTTQLGGWKFVSDGFLRAQGGSFGGLGLFLLIGLPAMAALLTLTLNVMAYRGRASGLTCGLALAAMTIGGCVLFGESTVTLIITLLYSFGGGTVANTAQVGLGLPLMFLGYIGVVAATLTMCARYWRRGLRAFASTGAAA